MPIPLISNTFNKEFALSIVTPENMTIYEAMEVRELFISALSQEQAAEVNLSQVTEIDSSGLQLMIALKNDAKKYGKMISFTEHSREVIELLDLFNLTTFFGDPVVLSDK